MRWGESSSSLFVENLLRTSGDMIIALKNKNAVVLQHRGLGHGFCSKRNDRVRLHSWTSSFSAPPIVEKADRSIHWWSWETVLAGSRTILGTRTIPNENEDAQEVQERQEIHDVGTGYKNFGWQNIMGPSECEIVSRRQKGHESGFLAGRYLQILLDEGGVWKVKKNE